MRREELELTVSGGRRLRTQLAGPADGELVVFHMGTPDSRHLFDGKLAEGAKRGVRHVCSSRPGYVVGGSSAGPCALACAALLPDRVISAAVVSSFAPRSAAGLDWVAGMGTWNLEGFAALDRGERDAALDGLLAELESGLAQADGPTREELRELLRRAIVGVLSEADPADPAARAYRRRLSAALG